MEFNDIFSKYPELATRLVRVSKTLNKLAYLGNCNLDLSINESMKILEIKPYQRKAIFNVYTEDYIEKRGIYFEAIIIITTPDWIEDNNYFISTYNAGAYSNKGYYMLGMDNINKKMVTYWLTNFNNLEIKSLDVRSAYLLYHDRPSCYQYAKLKTKQDFNKMIEKFNHHDLIVILNLYLMINCIVLDIDLSNEFLKAIKRFAANGEDEYNYDDYINDTESNRKYMINQINNMIDSF